MHIMANTTFKRSERIKSKRIIDSMFCGKSSSHAVYPLRVVYKEYENPTAILVSVAKKRFKRAVHRNRIKRLIREAYRLNKGPLLSLLENRNKSLAIAFIFISEKMPTFEKVESSINKMLTLIIEDMNKEDKKDA